MTRRARRLRAIKPLTPELESDPIVTVKCWCVGCGVATGKTMDVRKSEMPEGDPEVYDGTCPTCTSKLDAGHVIFVGTDGSVMFAPEAVGEDKRGKIINVDTTRAEIISAFEEARKKKL